VAYITKTRHGWRAQVERKGVRDSITLPTKSAAEQWATKREAEILAGGASAWPRKTLADALARYEREITSTKRGQRAESLRLLALQRDFPALAGKLMHAITADDLGQWRDARLAVVTPASVQRDINILRHVWTVAADEWQWCPSPTPWKSVRMPVATPPRDRRMGWREIRRIVRRCDYRTGVAPLSGLQGVAWALLVSLRTAMRAGEVLGLTTEAVDLGRRVVTLADHKTAHLVGRRQVPLTPQGARLLRVLVDAALSDGRLFALSAGSLDALFRRVVRQVLVPDVHFHDARATALTALSRRVDVLTLARISGHKNLQLLLSVYYRETAAEIAARLASPTRSRQR
jgi:integrase